ncbi:MAG: DNA translocase FtsK [Verrucomicrobiota bacterium]
MRKKEKPATEIKMAHELAAIVLMGVGILLLLALVSFEPNDVPFFSVGHGGEIDNFIGPVGAYVAAGLVIAFGAASYMVPIVMGIGGVLLIFAVRVNYWMKLLWFALIIITGAGLLQFMEPVIRPIDGMDWPGGVVGYGIHDWALARVIGNAGSVIVLLLVYCSSLILLFEVRPVELVRRSWSFTVGWYEERERRRFEEADPIEQLELEQKRLAREKKKLERKLNKNKNRDEYEGVQPDSASKRQPAAVEHENHAPNPAEIDEVAQRPEPKVIDTMAEMKSAATREKELLPSDENGAGVEALAAEPAAGAKAEPVNPGRIRKVKSDSGRLQVPDETQSFDDYRMPTVSKLDANENKGVGGMNEGELKSQQQLLVDTLEQFGIDVEPGDITKGATITRYEVYPAPGVRVERIAKMNKDIARAMRAESINILAPIPGKDTVGIEIGNADKAMIVLRDLLETDSWRLSKAKIPLALGKDVYGKVLIADLAEMPHLLIGGSTGSGKSVCINSILMSFLYKFSPEDLRIIMVDPKVVELQIYNDLPHLVVPVVTEPKKVLMALRWVINEMELRYRLMAKCGVRNVAAYNARQAEEKRKREAAAAQAQAGTGDPGEEDLDALPGFESTGDPDLPEKFPFIVVIIDELADLMATTAAEVELAISRLCAKARAAGIHLIIATQTPRAQVVTGVIKTNVPCRIAFKVPSALDSRVILDENGAENLLGKGDMLYLPPGSSKQMRAQGAFVSDEEVASVVDFIKDQSEPAFETEIHQKLIKSSGDNEEELSEADVENLEKALEIAIQEGKLSTSLLQRRARIGYNTAARIVDFLESKGILGAQEGAKPRELMINPGEFDVDGFLNEL